MANPFRARLAFVSVCLSLAFAVSLGCREQPDAVTTSGGPNSTPSITPKVEEPGSILERVLVIENTDSPVSMQIAKYYMEKRGVKKTLSIRCVDSALSAAGETLDYGIYLEAIEKPLREYLANDTKIDFIVLTKGIPLRLSNAPVGFAPGRPSLDSCVAALDYFHRTDSIRTVIVENDLKGTAYVNRFWNSTERFSHAKHGGYLVTRLDGYTAASAMALVDSSLAGEATKPTGPILLDSMAIADPVDASKVPLSPFRDGIQDMETIMEIGWNEWNFDLFAANERLKQAGVPVDFDRTENFIGNKQGLMGYASWGSNDAKYVAENYLSLRFAPGAIAETAVSTGARTFLPTSGGQSLIADLVEARVTGVKGYSDEPFLLAVASPSVLFDRYTRGWTLAESYYAASRFVGWEDIVIGDPLSAPYAKTK
jgi:uncharacterized protein (TIGR03790 family)